MFRQIRLTAQMTAALSASIISSKAHAQLDRCDGFQELGFKVEDCPKLETLLKEVPHPPKYKSPKKASEILDVMIQYKRQGEHADKQEQLETWQAPKREIIVANLKALGYLGDDKIPDIKQTVIGIIPGSLAHRFIDRANLAEDFDKKNSLSQLWLVTGDRQLKDHECPQLKSSEKRTESQCLRELARFFTARSSIMVESINESYHKTRATTVDNAIEFAEMILKNPTEYENKAFVLFIEPPFSRGIAGIFKIVFEHYGIDNPVHVYSGKLDPSAITPKFVASAGNELYGTMDTNHNLPAKLMNMP